MPTVRSLALLCLTCAILPAQTQPKVLDFNQHGWYVYNGEHKVAGRWGIHFDGQWRRSNVLLRWQQLLLRPGINFALHPKATLTAGYAFVRGYPYGDYPVRAAFPEHRIYQQLVLRSPKKNINITQRFRLEQRFIQYPTSPGGSRTYQNRFRYMLRADLPLIRKEDNTVRWYLPAWNEVLLGIAPNYGARSFDHNRLFIGVGRSLGKPGNLEVGYMNQFLGQRNGRIYEFNNTLSVTFTSTFDLSQLFR